MLSLTCLRGVGSTASIQISVFSYFCSLQETLHHCWLSQLNSCTTAASSNQFLILNSLPVEFECSPRAPINGTNVCPLHTRTEKDVLNIPLQGPTGPIKKHARLQGFVSIDLLFQTDQKWINCDCDCELFLLQFLSVNQQLLDSDFVANTVTGTHSCKLHEVPRTTQVQHQIHQHTPNTNIYPVKHFSALCTLHL